MSNISLINTITNINMNNYAIAKLEANKQYRVSFDIDDRMQFQFAQQKEGTNFIKPITRNLYGFAGNYSYVINSIGNGTLFLTDLKNILSGGEEWKIISNISVEEI